MASVQTPSTIPPEWMSVLQERADRASQGIVDPEDRRKARERMDRMREEYRRRFGEVNVAVRLIHEARDDS